MKIHIFYNGNEANFPANNEWEKFTGHDSVRVFLMCVESWERHGFEVARMSTEPIERDRDGYPVAYSFTPQLFKGRILTEGYKWYPPEFWQFIAKACSLDGDEFLFGTYDVINRGFYPTYIWDDYPFIRERGSNCVCWQADHFSMSLFYCNRAWLNEAANLLAAYDNGDLPRIPGKYVSDETILRKYAYYTHISDPFGHRAYFANNPNAKHSSLIHYARSSLRGAYANIPVV